VGVPALRARRHRRHCEQTGAPAAMTEDQIAKWKQALARHHKAQRRRRGKRKAAIERITGPGMVQWAPRYGAGGPPRK
jgi:hypothetical protein